MPDKPIQKGEYDMQPEKLTLEQVIETRNMLASAPMNKSGISDMLHLDVGQLLDRAQDALEYPRDTAPTTPDGTLPEKIRAAVVKAIESMPEYRGMKPANGDPITEVVVTDKGFNYDVQFSILIPGIVFSGA